MWLIVRRVSHILLVVSNKKTSPLGRDTQGGRDMIEQEKKVWGGITVYPRLFGVNISSMFLLRTTNKTGSLWLIRLDSTTPTIGESCTLARSQQACSVTHRKDYKPFQEISTNKEFHKNFHRNIRLNLICRLKNRLRASVKLAPT